MFDVFEYDNIFNYNYKCYHIWKEIQRYRIITNSNSFLSDPSIYDEVPVTIIERCSLCYQVNYRTI